MDNKKVNSREENLILAFQLNKGLMSELNQARKRYLKSIKNDSMKIIYNQNKLRAETKKIISKFSNLSYAHTGYIEYYIMFGNFEIDLSISQPMIEAIYETENKLSDIKVTIFKHTTKEQYMDQWDQIRHLQKQLIEYTPTNISKADLKIWELHNLGYNARMIADYLSEHSVELYGKDKLGDCIVESTIRSRISTLRKHFDWSKIQVSTTRSK